jgi:acyl dehydratase
LASGDDNPIHTDLAIARSAGLGSCVVPGMLIVGQFETAIRRWRPDARLASTSTRFVRPLLVGQSFTVHGHIIDGKDPLKMIWRILVRDEINRIVCICDACIL